MLWVAAWDHFAGGDSEVHVIAPFSTGWPPDLDLIYVEIQAWDKIKSTLSTLGIVRSGTDVIPAEIYRSFEDDSDFHEAIAFEGEYRTLITTLAAYECRQDLIPGLRRIDDWPSIVQAFVLASIEVGIQSPQLQSSEEYAAAISSRVVEAYAIPADYGRLTSLSAEFGQMLCSIPNDKREQLNGPIWMVSAEFEKARSQAVVVHPSVDVLITRESTVVLKSPLTTRQS